MGLLLVPYLDQPPGFLRVISLQVGLDSFACFLQPGGSVALDQLADVFS